MPYSVMGVSPIVIKLEAPLSDAVVAAIETCDLLTERGFLPISGTNTVVLIPRVGVLRVEVLTYLDNAINSASMSTAA